MKNLLRFALLVTLIYHMSGKLSMAQSCNCNINITKEGSYDGKYLGYKPGQTICLQAGNYKYLYFKNIVGTAALPIKIINCGGVVTVGTEAGQNGIQFYDSKFVKLTGSGDSRYRYGINLNKTPANYSGIVVTSFSSDFEIEKVEVSGTGFAGIMIKYDPTCDPATWRGTFSMYNIRVHDTYIHDTVGEGMYIGSSFWNSGVQQTCLGVATTVYPHNIYGLRIYNNLTERTGCEGIQYACAPEALVYNNVVKSPGRSPFAIYQDNGIQASGGTSGRLYNNIVQDAPGNGFNIIGHSGTNFIYNNLITDVGGAGIFCDNRAGTPIHNPIIFTNNTIVKSGLDGFRLYNELDYITLTNNAVIQAGTGKLLLISSGMQIGQTANYYQASLTTALATGICNSSYKPMAGSALVDKGVINTYWGITYDLLGQPRPKGTTIDIGAYEFQPTGSARSGAQTEWGIGNNLNGEESSMLTAYAAPSPCINEVSIKLDNYDSIISELGVYNMQGMRVIYIIPKLPASELTLQTGNLPTGIYIYKVLTTDLKSSSGRFIKQ